MHLKKFSCILNVQKLLIRRVLSSLRSIRKDGYIIMKKTVRYLFMLLVLCAAAVLAAHAHAEMPGGRCGENLFWSLDTDTGVLTVSGTGGMADYSGYKYNGVYLDSPAPWMEHQPYIKTVIIEDGITRIGQNAFNGCAALTGITIPKSVTVIGGRAFKGCTSLTEITLSKGVTAIEDSAFLNCGAIERIDLPDGLISIGQTAFSSCKALTSIPIPNSVTDIHFAAFADCSRLTNVTLSNSLSSIEPSVFSDCTSLTGVAIPESVLVIHENAFYNCAALTGITIPESVTNIEEWAFAGCGSLSGFMVADGNSHYANDESGVLYNKEKSELIRCPSTHSGTYAIPKSVTSVGSSTFENCTALTGITIPESVASIGHSAFKGCAALTDIVLPPSVTSIGRRAFANTAFYMNNANWEHGALYLGQNLIEVRTDIPGTYRIKAGTQNIADSAFENCRKITEILMPKSVASIGENAFKDCAALSNIYIPKGVAKIQSGTFTGCSALTSITIPEGVTSIGSHAFYSCKALTNILLPKSVAEIEEYVFNDCGNLTDIYYSGSDADWNKICIGSTNTELERIRLHCGYADADTYKGRCGTDISWSLNASSGVLKITGSGEMEDCTDGAKWSAYISSIKTVIVEYGVTGIGSCAFRDCTALTSIQVPAGIIAIGPDAFVNTDYYNNAANWEDGVLYVDAYLIKADASIHGACTTKPGTKVIADYAFADCTALETVIIAEDVESIGVYAFQNCSALSSVAVPKSVTQIGAGAFSGCGALRAFSGEPGSYAETWANTHGFLFEPLRESPDAPGSAFLSKNETVLLLAAAGLLFAGLAAFFALRRRKRNKNP